MELVKNESITSLQLLEKINDFREKENNRKNLRHKDLLAVIRNEFEQEITERKISLSEYRDKTGRKLPMFILTLSQAKQVLVRESKFVRRAVIQYIEKLENYIKQPQQVQIKLPKPYELVKKYYNGIPVMSILDLEYVFKIDRYSLHAYIKKFNISGVFLQGDELKKFKRDNPSVLSSVSCMYVFDFNGAVSLSKALNMTDKQKDLVAYYGIPVKVEDKYTPSDEQFRQAELLFKLTESMDYNFKHFFREYASYLIVGKVIYNNYKLALESNKVKNELRSMGKDIVAESAYEYKMTKEYMELPSNVKTYIDNMYAEVLNM
jgi:hypothetical protein